MDFKEKIMEKVFIDSDVLLDVLMERSNFYRDSLFVVNLAASSGIKGYTSPVVIANIFYLYSVEKSKKEAHHKIGNLLQFLQVVPLDNSIVRKAYSSALPDFEDAMIYFACLNENINMIVTRNVKDFPKEPIQIATPAQFINLFYNQ